MAGLMPIGRFSILCRLSVKALRHYDEVGLLRPRSVDAQSGYRYYSRGQLRLARAIALLRSLDMPLAEIREVVQQSDPGAVQRTLRRHRARIEERLIEGRRILMLIEQLLEEGVDMPYDVQLRQQPAQPILAIRVQTTPAAIKDEVSRAFRELYTALGQQGGAPHGPPATIYHTFNEDEVEMEAFLPVDRRVQDAGRAVAGELPAGPIATTLHLGPYEAVSSAHQALEAWISEHGHEIAGPVREVYLNSPEEVPDPAQYRTEVQWPVH